MNKILLRKPRPPSQLCTPSSLLAEAALAIQGLHGPLTCQELPTLPLHLLGHEVPWRPGSPAESPQLLRCPARQEAPHHRPGSWLKEQASPVFRDLATPPFHFLKGQTAATTPRLQTTGEVSAQLPRSGPTPQLY